MSTALDNSPADVLRWLLIALGLGSEPAQGQDWPIYVGMEPSTPDNVVTVYDTTGPPGERTQVDGAYTYHYGIQVRIRTIDYPTGYQKASAIASTLAERVYGNAVQVGDHNYTVYAVTGIGSVLALGKDAPNSKRSLFTINCNIVLSEN